MAINPNTDFSAGAVLLASQMNRLPRGVMAYNAVTASDTTITTTEEVQITGSSFTAVANRYYKITYFDPGLGGGTLSGNARIRLTNISGTVYQLQSVTVASTGGGFVHLSAVTTLSAGATNFVATLVADSGTIQAVRSSTRYAFLLVEDIGPA